MAKRSSIAAAESRSRSVGSAASCASVNATTVSVSLWARRGPGRVGTSPANPSASLTDGAFASAEVFDPRDLVQVKYEMVRRVKLEGAPVTSTAKAFGFSRPLLYEAARAAGHHDRPLRQDEVLTFFAPRTPRQSEH